MLSMLEYQVWAFVAPGLYRKEKRFAVPLLVSSIVLFYVGAAFAYKVVFPMAFHFFVASAPADILIAPDINNYLRVLSPKLTNRTQNQPGIRLGHQTDPGHTEPRRGGIGVGP